MRTPNSQCIICGKMLYRRPYELEKVRYVACMEHRYIAQRKYGQTESQKQALSLGREKGTNHLTGMPKSKESNEKRSLAHKIWCYSNPDKVAKRGEKIRGENHYRWNGGSSRLNTSIRTMTEHRNWMDGVRDRDGWQCTSCGSLEFPEAHHKIALSDLIVSFNIKTRDDARNCAELWDLNNGVTLCQKCHYKKHGRIQHETFGINLQATS